jgi:hypothetical protein
MFTPSPGLWPGLIEDRQHRLRSAAHPRPGALRVNSVRVRLGHLLIAAGRNLSGERVEMPARRPALPRSA